MSRGARRAVFLDRDGTLNRSFLRDGVPVPPQSIEELEILPGVPEALATLKAAGFALVVVTNQPDVARGTLTEGDAEAVNEHLQKRLLVDAVLACYHDDVENCACRKPAPGMLIDAAERFRLHLPSSFLVGDRWRDIEAGRRAGCTTVLLRNGYSESHRTKPDFEASSLVEAAALILRRSEEATL